MASTWTGALRALAGALFGGGEGEGKREPAGPSTVDHAWEEIERWVAKKAPRLVPGLRPGASDEALASAERSLGVTLPGDVRASWRRHDGAGSVDGESPLLRELYSLPEIVSQWKTTSEALRDVPGATAPAPEEGVEIGDDGEERPAPGAVRCVHWSERWIPFAGDGAGSFWCIDLDPGPNGRAGQVIDVGHGESARPVLARSLATWLARYAADLRKKRLVYVKGEGVLPAEDVFDDEGPKAFPLEMPRVTTLKDMSAIGFRPAIPIGPEVKEAFLERVRHSQSSGYPRVVLDLSKVPSFDPGCAAALATLGRKSRAKGCAVALCRVPAALSVVFEPARKAGDLPQYPDPESAFGGLLEAARSR